MRKRYKAYAPRPNALALGPSTIGTAYVGREHSPSWISRCRPSAKSVAGHASYAGPIPRSTGPYWRRFNAKVHGQRAGDSTKDASHIQKLTINFKHVCTLEPNEGHTGVSTKTIKDRRANGQGGKTRSPNGSRRRIHG